MFFPCPYIKDLGYKQQKPTLANCNYKGVFFVCVFLADLEMERRLKSQDQKNGRITEN